jgi:hypothetical protein
VLVALLLLAPPLPLVVALVLVVLEVALLCVDTEAHEVTLVAALLPGAVVLLEPVVLLLLAVALLLELGPVLATVFVGTVP